MQPVTMHRRRPSTGEIQTAHVEDPGDYHNKVAAGWTVVEEPAVQGTPEVEAPAPAPVDPEALPQTDLPVSVPVETPPQTGRSRAVRGNQQ